MEESELNKAFTEYYRLATMPCTNPTKESLEKLEAATEKYMELLKKS